MSKSIKSFVTATALLIWLAMLAPSNVLAVGVTSDSYSTGNCGNTSGAAGVCTGGGNTPITVSHVTGGTATAMSVFITVDCDGAATAPSVLSVVYDTTQNLSLTTSVSPAIRRRMELWSLPAGTAPNAGTKNLLVTLNGDIDATCLVARLVYVAIATSIGTDNTTLYTDTKTGNGTGTTASAALSSSGGNDLVLFASCAGSSFSGNTGTQKWNLADGTIDCASQRGAENAGGVTNPTTTISGSDTWLAISASLKASGGGGGGGSAPKMTLLGVGP